MRVLVGCEYSARVRDQFRALGHDAWSCDLLPCEGDPRWHIQGDVFDAIENRGPWDVIILHPPCTRLTVSGAWFVERNAWAKAEQVQSILFVEKLWTTAKRCARKGVVLENPIGVLSTKSILGKPTQIVQPYNFGEDASKATCLWLDRIRPFVGTSYVEPRLVDGKKRWANQTDSGQNRLGPSEDRWKERSRTYLGIAKAMAEQITEQLERTENETILVH